MLIFLFIIIFVDQDIIYNEDLSFLNNLLNLLWFSNNFSFIFASTSYFIFTFNVLPNDLVLIWYPILKSKQMFYM
jgi:hypothetical protein